MPRGSTQPLSKSRGQTRQVNRSTRGALVGTVTTPGPGKPATRSDRSTRPRRATTTRDTIYVAANPPENLQGLMTERSQEGSHLQGRPRGARPKQPGTQQDAEIMERLQRSDNDAKGQAVGVEREEPRKEKGSSRRKEGGENDDVQDVNKPEENRKPIGRIRRHSRSLKGHLDHRQASGIKEDGKRVTSSKRSSASPTLSTPSHDRAVNKKVDEVFDEVCALSRQDISDKAKFIKDFIENEIIKKIKLEDEQFDFDIFRAGSYYEGLKVEKANEFDLMVVLKSIRIGHSFKIKVCQSRRSRTAKDLVGFAYLEYQEEHDPHHHWCSLLTEGPDRAKVLSPRLILERFDRLVNIVISRECRKHGWSSNVAITGPAVNVSILRNHETISVDLVLSIEIPEGWPSIAGRWGTFSHKWPSYKDVEEIKSNGYHVVPKECPSESESPNPVHWRISFSKAEKALLKKQALDDDKKYYRIVKCIFERRKTELHPLCSYHLKTLLLHRRAEGKMLDNEDGNKIDFLCGFIKDLRSKVKLKLLRHFFIQDLNLFVRFMSKEVERIIVCLDRIITDLLHEPVEFLQTIKFPEREDKDRSKQFARKT